MSSVPHRHDCDHPACQQGQVLHRSRGFANQAERRRDPTRTKTARRRFAQHLRARWDAIKFHINRGIVENDAFGLRGPDTGEIDLQANVETNDDLTPGTGQFDFPSDADAVEAFGEWLDEAVEQEILEEYDGDRYIRKGYSRGVKHADARLREVDVDVPDQEVATVLQLPVHRDKLELLYTRAFEDLDGVTEAAAQQIRRELTEGLAQGQNPEDIARTLNDRVEKVGKTRATVLARTEIVRAHTEASLDRYETIAGDVNVTVQAEFTTAGDDRVCEVCEALEGRRYTIKEARGLIPVHPRCRCAFVPVPEKSSGSNAAQDQVRGADQVTGRQREAPECEECSTPLAESRARCIHCDLAAARSSGANVAEVVC